MIYLDIETIPGQTPEARTCASASVKPPGTLKKPESIAAWWETEAPAAEREAWHKQALDGGNHGEIISIAAATDVEGQQWVRCRAQGESEVDLLREYYEVVEGWQHDEARANAGSSSYWPADVFPVAHNAAFDLGFLWRRSIVLGVPMPSWIPGPLARAGKDYGCTMQAWAGFGQRVSLAALCRALGIPSPKDGGIDGAGVFDAWQAGEYERIAAYNLRDALTVGAIWQRIAGRGV